MSVSEKYCTSTKKKSIIYGQRYADTLGYLFGPFLFRHDNAPPMQNQVD